MNSILSKGLDSSQGDSAAETPPPLDPNKIYAYAVFLKKVAATTAEAKTDGGQFARDVGIEVAPNDIFQMGSTGVTFLTHITPTKAAELEKDPRVQ